MHQSVSYHQTENKQNGQQQSHNSKSTNTNQKTKHINPINSKNTNRKEKHPYTVTNPVSKQLNSQPK